MPEPAAAPTLDRPKPTAFMLTGLLMGVLLAALDQTVVGTSLGKITADIGGFERFPYLFAAYMLASTVVIPLAGKLSDLYGRRPIYMAGMVLFLIGSALCGLAQNMDQLILYRGVQGLGGGVIFPVALATVADLYAPSDRGRIQGLFGGVFGISSIIGPFIGGAIVDNVTWRWVFYVNLPVGIIAIAMVFFHFPRVQNKILHPLDGLGVATLSAALVTALLITIWGGNTYAWDSIQILALVVLAVASFGAFILVERSVPDPVLPLDLFAVRVFALGAVATLLMGAGMFGLIALMPTYLQGVAGISATNSGAAMMPLSLSLVFSVITSGQLMKRFGYKPFMLLGTLLAAAGFAFLGTGGSHPAVWHAIVGMIVVGLGLGLTIQTYIVAAQNVVQRRLIGVATSTLTLIRTLGATFGVTVLGLVLTHYLRTELPKRIAPQALAQILANPFIDGHVDRIPSLLLRGDFTSTASPATVDGIKVAYSHGMTAIFLVGCGLSILAFFVTIFMPAHRLKTAEEYHEAPRPVMEPV